MSVFMTNKTPGGSEEHHKSTKAEVTKLPKSVSFFFPSSDRLISSCVTPQDGFHIKN